jgi:hypothetical protein
MADIKSGQKKLLIQPNVVVLSVIIILVAIGFLVHSKTSSGQTIQDQLSELEKNQLNVHPSPTPIPSSSFDVSKAINAGYSYYEVIKYLEQYDASHSAMIVRNVPNVAPSPTVEYRTQTQYVQTPAQEAPKQPVTYFQNGNFLYGNDGSRCFQYGGFTKCQ